MAAKRADLIILVQQLIRSQILPKQIEFIGEDEDIPNPRGNAKICFRVNYASLPAGSASMVPASTPLAGGGLLGLLTLLTPSAEYFVSYDMPLELSQWLLGLRHSYVDTLACCCWLTDRKLLLCLRYFHPRRSLADLIASSGPVDVKLIQLFGAQILEGLMYFFTIGYPYGGCLHPGNVLLRSDTHVVLSDYENAALSLSPSYLLVHSNTMASEVEAFGYLLYEMATGKVPPTPDARHPAPLSTDALLAHANPALLHLMRTIFQADAGSPPTLMTLREHPFFAVTVTDSHSALPDTSPSISAHLQALKRSFIKSNKAFLTAVRKRQAREAAAQEKMHAMT